MALSGWVQEHGQTWIPAPGEVLLDKYRVDGVIGRGGMGVVFAATHLSLQQKVAIKLLTGEAAAGSKAQTRFAREAQAAARIQSEHVTRVSDVGQLPNGTPYIVMEYLDGEDLAALLARVGRLPIGDAVRYVLEACEALAEAHREGIVHRDLKPANLFLARRPDGQSHIKVLDFGISKILPISGVKGNHDLTRTAALMGSPLYMSPEQMRSAKQVDVRSDIWAIGTILFELVTGVSPFNGDTLPEVCSRILTAEPTSMAAALGGEGAVPVELERAIVRCLDKEPGTRVQNVAELASAIAPFGGDDALRSAQMIQRVLGVAAALPAGSSQPLAIHPPVAHHPPALHVPLAPTINDAANFPAPAFSSTSAPVANTMPEGVPRRNAGVFLFAAIGAGVLVLGGVLVFRLGPERDAPRSDDPASAAAAAPAAPPRVKPASTGVAGAIGSASTRASSEPRKPATPIAGTIASATPLNKGKPQLRPGDDLFHTHHP